MDLFLIKGFASIILVSLGFVAVCVYLNTKFEGVCLETKVIEEVGGCGQYANCGVKYTDGSFGVQFKPVRGESFCTQSELRLRK